MVGITSHALKGIGEKRAEVLASECDIETAEDLLCYRPRRYIDNSSFSKIADLEIDVRSSVVAYVTEAKIISSSKKFLQVTVGDESASMKLYFFGAISYYAKVFSKGTLLLLSGKPSYSKKQFSMVHPEFDVLSDEAEITGINSGRIVPVYPLNEKMREAGISTRVLRKIIFDAINDGSCIFMEPFDKSVLGRFAIPEINRAVKSIHFPETMNDANTGRRRLAFNELLVFQLYLAMLRKVSGRQTQNPVKNTEALSEFIESLPFKLTDDQLAAIADISKNLQTGVPMNRLLQGDVGCGKTVVAVCAAVLAKKSGWQCAVMAPTEILASQLYHTFEKLAGECAKIALLTSSVKKSDKEKIAKQSAEGEIDVIIGTQAIIQSYVSFKNLRLVIIDEQHRFGVSQRTALREKGAGIPHLLSMTATPIPRSLALTLYGDFDLSVIKTKPSGRGDIKTMIFPESRMDGVINSIKKYVSQGRQAYIVLPLIEESEKTDLKSAVQTYNSLKSGMLNGFSISLLHGKMKQEEKDDVMNDFRSGKTQILVSTTVIEVGVDVSNANIMVIYHAERFGISQLHQLRGRVGRGRYDSFCVLIHPEKTSGESLERLQMLERSNDGFELSEMDLKIRGHGELIGSRQSGFITEFEFADISEDIDIINQAREYALELCEKIECSDETDIGKNLEQLRKSGLRIKRLHRYIANLT